MIMRYKVLKAMRSLQLFAEGEGAGAGGSGDGGGAGGSDGAGEGAAGGSDGKLSFEDFLQQEGNQAEFDRRVQKAIDTAVSNAQEKWKTIQDDKISEAKKLEKMNAQEKAEYKQRQLEKKIQELEDKEALSNMRDEARKQLSDKGINIPDKLLLFMVSKDAEETKTAVDSFTELFHAAVNEAVKGKARQTTPKEGGAFSDKGTSMDIGKMAREARIIK